MLKFNFPRIFKARGVDRPFAYLKDNGFSDSFASRIVHNRVERLNLTDVERICTVFQCTPNDLLEWTPSAHVTNVEQHALNPLRRTQKLASLTRLINSMPLDKLTELEAEILKRME